MPLIEVPQTDSDPLEWQKTRPRLGPLDEDNGVLEVRLDVPPLGARHRLEAVEVEMGDLDSTRVYVADRVGRVEASGSDQARSRASCTLV